ncbi:hypothetical protein [Pseudomonas sp. 24 E 13]|jgi:hypothetical protein|uniref:Uncharacterized protein n=1 Tax=Pseudomonas orientalis TaxID=76758 RepID=A0A2L0RSI9_9PSED|nr:MULTISPECIES: hypothetical protein [Pseudomonas]AUZ45085.1 hypothetical protein BOP93_05615 [Pseudomonas orientalis]MBY8930433.1 hypothetical protein [Pseudomonas sp. Wu6]RZI32579.1 hypothetical protein EUX57_06435 [Pseudomonas orientalis]CRM15808.1 hypothetical protein [Pseudomonas sp. 44 R 15]CRM83933.1 hypothetical protein [Pseudomonas sp. 24 E 13]
MTSTLKYQILAGLPGEGPLPLQFSATGQGHHSEGVVIRFSPEAMPSWVGNFQPGFCRFSCVLELGSTFHVMIVAGGQGYIVDIRSGVLLKHFGGDIEYLVSIPELDSVLVSNGLWLRLVKGEAEVWCSERLSLDGIRNIQVSLADGIITGEGWYVDDCWYPFKVCISSGEATGGVFESLDFS